MGRAQLGDLAVFRIGRAPCLEIGHDDALVRHDDEEHVGGHDGGGKGPEMQHGCAAGEDLVIAPAHHDKRHKEQQHQSVGVIAEL